MVSLAISPCPNDTFAFYALLHGKTSHPVPKVSFHDIERLNKLCFEEKPDICKISFGAYLKVRDRYKLLNSGSALGHGCGPLIVTRGMRSIEQLRKTRILVPGKNTTAALLLRLLLGPEVEMVEMIFDRIMPMVASGAFDAGLIIHESRFTYPRYGLQRSVDLGEWWESHSGHPIPLGGIVARRELPEEQIKSFDAALAESVDYAWKHPNETTAFMRDHAAEMEPDVMNSHVDLYVNKYTHNLGEAGHAAIDYLVAESRRQGLLEDASE